MKTIKSMEYVLMNLDTIKKDVRCYDDDLKESGILISNIAIVVELKGDGSFTHHVQCVDWSLNEVALDAYKVVVAKFVRDHDDNKVLELSLRHLEEAIGARLARERIIERKLSAMGD